ncbi:hypothetical protein MferCBS31731_004286 [Microsporum ferrugineum]
MRPMELPEWHGLHSTDAATVEILTLPYNEAAHRVVVEEYHFTHGIPNCSPLEAYGIAYVRRLVSLKLYEFQPSATQFTVLLEHNDTLTVSSRGDALIDRMMTIHALLAFGVTILGYLQ